MEFSGLLQSRTGRIRFGTCGFDSVSSSWSRLFGRKLICRKFALGQQARVFELKIDCKISGSVRNESSGGERRDEEKGMLLGVASASIGFNAVILMSVAKPAPRISYQRPPSSWLSLPLLAVWGAILLNAFVQYRVLDRLIWMPQRRERTGRADYSLKQRVVELEENAREFVTTARALSKQVEKLGVRFRATRRTLRDPIQETAVCAQTTSEVVTVLAQREDELQEELRELQRALLAMQDQQVKQLALISLALKRTQQGGQVLNPKSMKRTENSVNGSSAIFRNTPDSYARGLMGTEAAINLQGHEKAVEWSGSSSRKSTQDVGSESDVYAPSGVSTGLGNVQTDAAAVDHYNTNGKSQIVDGSSKSLKPESNFSSEGRLSLIDFWKESVTPPVTPPASGKVTASFVSSNRGDSSESSKIGNFFNGRKRTVANPTSGPESALKDEGSNLKSETLEETEDELSFVEQPDYDSDSWLR